MRIVDSADWRDRLTYETPYRVAEVMPGDAARCASCPADAAPYDRDHLWAVKHRHPTNHGGFVRFYCEAHVPERKLPAVPVVRAAPARRSTPRSAASRTPQTPAASDVVRAMCPDCFVEVSATGECGICGNRV
ncbi:glucose-6-phosphate dehydrogenase [Microbacterium thalli]|uniref:Glucose-6-phosphate dehydrogenase n=1 Tax=Microbacterium thalli TaxID=3027921 RepID=A0ABT5SJH7_9MICO|nr:glucose-6-phosphate dehydrogenase [Microbacterium thalli]MDD7962969.1 glucose-6-phosphate dehydrogenase [Microbacterium thalli]